MADLHSLTVNQQISETASNSAEKQVILSSHYGRSSFLNLHPCAEEEKQANNEYEQDEDSSEDEEFYR